MNAFQLLRNRAFVHVTEAEMKKGVTVNVRIKKFLECSHPVKGRMYEETGRGITKN
jgi:hypothetical protein